jgi:hypothetical protein
MFLFLPLFILLPPASLFISQCFTFGLFSAFTTFSFPFLHSSQFITFLSAKANLHPNDKRQLLYQGKQGNKAHSSEQHMVNVRLTHLFQP